MGDALNMRNLKLNPCDNGNETFRKILIADNNPVVLKLLSNLLIRNGYEVATAEDGLSVLEILSKFEPDAILIDLIMPNIDGERLCRIIRGMPHMKNIPLVIVSALAAEENIAFTELGANACVAKGPFDKMSHDILCLLKKIAAAPSAVNNHGTLGLDNVRPREITKELLSAKRHLEAILSSISDGILEVDSCGRIVYANPEALHILRQSESKLLASDILELFNEQDRPMISSLIKNKPGSGVTTNDDLFLQDGKEISLTVANIKNDQKKLFIIKDISARKVLESQLRQAQKMEAIGTLAGGLAHDFNNLLMGIQGRISLMLMNASDNSFFEEHLKSIEDIVLSGSNLTRQLLGFARVGKYSIEPSDLNQTIRKSIDMFARIKKEISIEIKEQPQIWTVEIDRSRIEQAFLNLLINAWQAMPGGGKITIETENISLDDTEAEFYRIEPGKYVRMSFADTGVGMDKKTSQRIFEPFFTTKEMSRGSGLGLASTYGTIKGHNGIIDVKSRKGEGTTFTIFLPASDKQIPKEKKSYEEIVSGKETVLLVDDEKIVTDVIREILENLGYSVITASGGREAIDLYRQHRAGIDLVILDMIMPQITGSEVFDELKSIDPSVKVILCSGYSLKGHASTIMNRGCRAFLQKPFNTQFLSKTIRSVLDS